MIPVAVHQRGRIDAEPHREGVDQRPEGEEGGGYRAENAHGEERAAVGMIYEVRLGKRGEEVGGSLGSVGSVSGAGLAGEPELVAGVQVVEAHVSGAVAANLDAARTAPQDRRVMHQIHDGLLQFVTVGDIMNP